MVLHKVLIGLVGAFFAAAQPSFATTYFVVPGGTGAGTSWADGASLEAVLGNVSGDAEIRLKSGVYPLSARTVAFTVTDAAVTIRGGYAGVSVDEEPSGGRYATVITDDEGLDNVWVKYDPETDTESIDIRGTGAAEPEKVIANGALNLPPELSDDDYVVYYPAHWSAGESSSCQNLRSAPLFKVSGASRFRVENLTFSGFGNSDANKKSTFDKISLHAGCVLYLRQDGDVDPSCGYTLDGVAFIGNWATSYLIGADGSAAVRTKLVKNCEFRFCRSDITSVVHDGSGTNATGTDYSGCVFASLVGRDTLREGGTNPSGAIAIGSPTAGRTGAYVITNCTFTHLVLHNTVALNKSTECHFVLWPQKSYGAVTIADCTFTCNYVKSPQRTWLVGDSGTGGIVRNLTFFRNYTEVDCSAQSSNLDRVFAPSLISVGNNKIVDGINAVSNTYRFASSTAVTALVAPVHATGVSTAMMNSHFFDNTVEASLTTEGGKLRWSRAVVVDPAGSGASTKFNVMNCTFCGSTPGDDIVLATSLVYPTVDAATRSFAFDSIFWSSAEGYAGMSADQSNWGFLDTCIVKNLGLGLGNVTATGCSGDDPMLVYDPVTRLCSPTVRVRGVRGLSGTFKHVDSKGVLDFGLTNSAYHAEQGKVGNVFKLIAGNFKNELNLCTDLPDIRGTVRRANDATAGAVETDLPEGHVLAASVATLGGSVSLGSQYAADGVYQPVTAIAADGFAFSKWVDEDGETVSTDATYTPVDDADYKSIRAVFAAPNAHWTFSAAPGTFADGTTEKTFELAIGDAAPEPPELVAPAGWYAVGWNETIPPTVVSTADLGFTAKFIPAKAVLYYDSHVDGGNADGSSWEDAFSELHLALAEAAKTEAHVVELRVKQGVHMPFGNSYSQIPFANVQLVGGFTGNGDERTTDRRATIFLGDLKADDVFLDSAGNELGRVFDDEGQFFDFESNTPVDGCVRLDTTKATTSPRSNYGALFVSADIACDESRIEGLTFTGYGSVLTFRNYNYVTVTNCDFIGCYAKTFNSAAADSACGARITDCGFYGGVQAPLDVDNNTFGDQAAFDVDHCVFGWYGTIGCNRGQTGLYVRFKGRLCVDSCEFKYFYTSFTPIEGEVPDKSARRTIALDGGALVLRNCHIHDCRLIDNVQPNTLVYMTAAGSEISGCTFENIDYSATYVSANANKNGDIALVTATVLSNCTFRNISMDYDHDGDNATLSPRIAMSSAGAWDLRIEDCHLSTTLNGRPTVALVSGNHGLLGEGFIRNCTVATTGTGVPGVLSGKVSGLAVNGYVGGIGRYSIDHNAVAGPNAVRAVLVDGLKSVTDADVADGVSIVANTVSGGSEYAAIIGDYGTTFRNVTVADNDLTGGGENAIVATVYRFGGALDVGWSTFAGNKVDCEFYFAGTKYRMLLTSSVVASDAEGWTPYVFTSAASALYNGITVQNSYLQGANLEDGYLSGEGIYTTAPALTGPVRRKRDGRWFVYHAPQSPYAKGNPELAGVWSEDMATDAVGVMRPEDDVRIGAVQETYAPKGLSVLIR